LIPQYKYILQNYGDYEMVNKYSLKKDGETSLSTNFKVKEFACNDGSDEILIDSDLVEALQKIRDKFGKPVTINSAYRTVTYNKKVGGSTSSYHTKGTAVDIKIAGVSAVEIAYYAQEIINGVGVYYYGTSDFVHIDTRKNIKHWLCAKAGAYEYYDTDLMPVLKRGQNVNKTTAVKFLQKKLGLNIDG
jgi:hypothetical protein